MLQAHLAFAVLIVVRALTACSPTAHQEPGPLSLNDTGRISPLDTILGDKLLDPEGPVIRRNNFEQLIGLSKQDVARGSVLYTARWIGHSLCALDQTKQYSEARTFTLLLKFQDDHIIHHIALDDQRIVDHAATDASDVLVLCDDSENHGRHWEPRNVLQVIRLDTALRHRWSYIPRYGTHPIRARSIHHGVSTRVQAEVVTGCSICFSVVELVLDTTGHCVEVREIGRQNSSVHLTQDHLNDLFLGNPMGIPAPTVEIPAAVR